LYLKSGKLLEAGTAFGALLTANTTLKSLHMSSTSFDDESLMPIITALHHNTTLANLSLREEAQAIFRPIRPTVRHLLPGQVASPAPPIECFTQAASELAAVVRSTRSLTKLHITVCASLSLSLLARFSQLVLTVSMVHSGCQRMVREKLRERLQTMLRFASCTCAYVVLCQAHRKQLLLTRSSTITTTAT